MRAINEHRNVIKKKEVCTTEVKTSMMLVTDFNPICIL
jgi:hypothetical protein